MTNHQSIQVVVGIDFGTSRSGYAYAFMDDKQVVIPTKWDDEPIPYIKTLTQSLYSPNKELDSWGWTARKKLAQLRKNREAKDYNLFQNFKMELREGKNRTIGGPVITTNNGKRFLVVDLIADYLAQMKGVIRQEIDAATSGFLKDNEILWCLTIPAIWTDADKQLMRRASQKAGLIGYDAADAERLLLVLEPEAAAIACQEKDKSQLKPGTRFMVVDCGGGTVDITTHEVIPGQGLRELVEGTGGAYGSTYVDRTFREYLEKKLTSEVIGRFHDEEPIDFLEMMADWERTKCNFNPATSGDIIYFPIQTKLYKMLLKDYSDILENLAEQQDGDDEKIHLDANTMKAIFNPTLDGLVKKVTEQLSKLDSRGCDIIYLVGGFSTSPLLRQRIEEKFSTQVKNIVKPTYPGSAIVEGAVSFGLNPSIIRSRRSRLTYGCRFSAPFNSNLDPKSKRYFAEDQGKWYCSDRFDVFVLAGDSVAVDEKIKKTFTPINRDQTRMVFTFYATKNKNIRYTDEPQVEQIGEITVDIPDITNGLNRSVEVTMYFGKTEIKVEAKDLTSGKQYNTTLRFSSTYSSELIGS